MVRASVVASPACKHVPIIFVACCREGGKEERLPPQGMNSLCKHMARQRLQCRCRPPIPRAPALSLCTICHTILPTVPRCQPQARGFRWAAKKRRPNMVSYESSLHQRYRTYMNSPLSGQVLAAASLAAVLAAAAHLPQGVSALLTFSASPFLAAGTMTIIKWRVQCRG